MTEDLAGFRRAWMDAMAAKQIESIQAFGRLRGIDMDSLVATAATTMPDVQAMMLVSTVTNGLAGTTSDIDLIAVSRSNDLPEERMSSMAFRDGQRLGIKLYSADEISEAIAAASALLADQGPHVRIRVRSWDSRAVVSWMDLERVANGINVDGARPYAYALPVVAALWTLRWADEMLQALVCSILAGRCGFERGAVGYLYYASSCLQNTAMAACGRLHSNRKWIQERWRLMLAGGEDQLPSAVARAAELVAEWSASPGAPAMTARRKPMLERAASALMNLGIEVDLSLPLVEAAPVGADFVPGAYALPLFGGAGLGVFEDRIGASKPTIIGFGSANELDAEDSYRLLRLIRGQLAEIAYIVALYPASPTWQNR